MVEVSVNSQALLTESAKLPGLDGRKMSKSYNNSIFLREEPGAIAAKIRPMQTDPARVRRNDPGDPEKCPVWPLHQVYSDKATQELEEGVREFRKVITNYPRGEKVPTALYKEALALLELKQPSMAEARLQYLIENFPRAEETPLARDRLATLKDKQ